MTRLPRSRNLVFCDDALAPLPFPTVFNSANWWSTKTAAYSSRRNDLAPSPWSNGEPPGPNSITIPFGSLFEAFDNTHGPVLTSLQPGIYDQNCTLIAIIATYCNPAANQVLSVTDNSGNTYVRDFAGSSSFDPKLHLDVWRAFNTVKNTNLLVTVTFLNPAYATWSVLSIDGLDDKPPSPVVAKTVPALTPVSLPDIQGGTGCQLILLAGASRGWLHLEPPPTAFTLGGFGDRPRHHCFPGICLCDNRRKAPLPPTDLAGNVSQRGYRSWIGLPGSP